MAAEPSTEVSAVQNLGPTLRRRLFRQFEYVEVASLSSDQQTLCQMLVSEGILCLESIEGKGPCYYFAMPVFVDAQWRKAG